MTKWGEVNGLRTISILNNHLVYHVFTKSDSFHKLGVGNEDIEHLNTTHKPKSQVNLDTENLLKEDHATFTLNQYSADEFHGIMPDSGAVGISSVGEQ
jgi:hypothetical protein